MVCRSIRRGFDDTSTEASSFWARMDKSTASVKRRYRSWDEREATWKTNRSMSSQTVLIHAKLSGITSAFMSMSSSSVSSMVREVSYTRTKVKCSPPSDFRGPCMCE